MAALEQTTAKRAKRTEGKQSNVQQAILEAEQNAQLKYRGRPSVDDYDERAVCSGHAHEIVPGLYLGSMHSCAADKGDALAALGVTGIINCTTDQEAACHHQRTSSDAAAPAAAPATDAAASPVPRRRVISGDVAAAALDCDNGGVVGAARDVDHPLRLEVVNRREIGRAHV